MSTNRQRSSGILLALALCMALQMTGFIMILPLFALRLESFGAGVKALGISATAYALTSTVSAPFIGMLADRFGRRPVILVSLAAYAGAFSGYLYATSAWLFILLRGLAGVFTAGLVPAIVSSVGDLASEHRRAQWIGIVSGGASIGWIIGPIIGGWLYDRFGYVVPFTASIAMELVALLLALILVPETYTPSAHVSGTPLAWTRGFRGLSAIPAFSLTMLVSFGVMFAWAFSEPQLMFYAYDDLAWTSSQLGLIMSTFGFACTVGEFSLGRLSDRLGRKPVLLLGLTLFSAQFIGLTIFRDVPWIVVSFIIAGLGNAIFDPALSALILDLTPSEYTARMMGLKSTVGSLGNMLGPAFVVLVTPFAGPQVVFFVSAALVLLITIASTFALRVPPMNEVSSDFLNTAVSR